jgi:hypothetical protein
MSEPFKGYMVNATEKILNAFLAPRFPEIEEIKVSEYADDRVSLSIKVSKVKDIMGFASSVDREIKPILSMIGGIYDSLGVTRKGDIEFNLLSRVFFPKSYNTSD